MEYKKIKLSAVIVDTFNLLLMLHIYVVVPFYELRNTYFALCLVVVIKDHLMLSKFPSERQINLDLFCGNERLSSSWISTQF